MKLSFSVAMCTFNGSEFLGAQLQSIADQSRLPDELVICDDGSVDGSERVAEQFARTAPFRVRVFRNPRNLGSAENFEKAIASCAGSIVVLADQDDIWYTHKLAWMEKAFLVADEIVGVFSDADLIDARSRRLAGKLWESFSFSKREQKRFSRGDEVRILIKHPVITGATLAFRRDLVDLLLPIPTRQMHDTWIAFLLAASGRIATIAEPLMQYRQHASQQIGPGLRGFRERWLRAQNTGPDFYFEETRKFGDLQQRLEKLRGRLPRAEQALGEIKRKLVHRQLRATLPGTVAARIPVVMREIFNRSYWSYSEGWPSVAKDFAGLTAKHAIAVVQQVSPIPAKEARSGASSDAGSRRATN